MHVFGAVVRQVPIDYTKNNASYTKLDQDADEHQHLTSATDNDDDDDDQDSVYATGPEPKRIDLRTSGGEVVSPKRP